MVGLALYLLVIAAALACFLAAMQLMLVLVPFQWPRGRRRTPEERAQWIEQARRDPHQAVMHDFIDTRRRGDPIAVAQTKARMRAP